MALQEKTLDFLHQLSLNNDKTWFEAHKSDFTKVKKDFEGLVNNITALLNKHDVIEKSKIFRIYRDVRFSADKTPYKTHLGCHFVRQGAHRRGGYYLQVGYDNSFLAGGFWNPENADLKRIREEFAADHNTIDKIVSQKSFINSFGSLQGDSLKSMPRGFDKDSPGAPLIKMKQYIVVKNFSNKETLEESFASEVDGHFKVMRPFFDYMSDVLTTDLNGESVI